MIDEALAARSSLLDMRKSARSKSAPPESTCRAGTRPPPVVREHERDGRYGVRCRLRPRCEAGAWGRARGTETQTAATAIAARPSLWARAVRCEGGRRMAEIIGTFGNDPLIGTAEPDNIFGLGAGDDAASGGDGDDVLSGGEDDDQLRSAASDDQLLGGPGRDRLDGGEGDDVLAGNRGADAWPEVRPTTSAPAASDRMRSSSRSRAAGSIRSRFHDMPGRRPAGVRRGRARGLRSGDLEPRGLLRSRRAGGRHALSGRQRRRRRRLVPVALLQGVSGISIDDLVGNPDQSLSIVS